MLGCLNCKYADCIFIRRRLKSVFSFSDEAETDAAKELIRTKCVMYQTRAEKLRTFLEGRAGNG